MGTVREEVKTVAPFRLGYRPALDGIRAIAILFVLTFHTLTFLDDSYSPSGLEPFRAGSLGVDIFFALSGFLITSLLLQEWQERGAISLKRFYVRRALRLWPALWVTLGLLSVYFGVVGPGETGGFFHGLIEVVTYSNNYFVSGNQFLRQWFGQSWSLAIEEQFYIVWPTLLIMLLHFRRTRKALPLLLATAVVLAALWRVELIHHYQVWSRVYFRTDARLDQLLIGALLAVLLHYGLVRVKPRPWLAAAAFIGCFALAQSWWSYEKEYFYYSAFLTVFTTCCLILGVLDGTGPVARLLSVAPVRWIGRVSYTLYLVHIPVIEAVAIHFGNRHGVNLEKAVVANVAIFVITAGIHYGVEVPGNRLKNRLSRVAKPVEAVAAAV